MTTVKHAYNEAILLRYKCNWLDPLASQLRLKPTENDNHFTLSTSSLWLLCACFTVNLPHLQEEL